MPIMGSSVFVEVGKLIKLIREQRALGYYYLDCKVKQRDLSAQENIAFDKFIENAYSQTAQSAANIVLIGLAIGIGPFWSTFLSVGSHTIGLTEKAPQVLDDLLKGVDPENPSELMVDKLKQALKENPETRKFLARQVGFCTTLLIGKGSPSRGEQLMQQARQKETNRAENEARLVNAATNAVREVFENHTNTAVALRREKPYTIPDFLSDKVVSSALPESVKPNIANLQKRVRLIINQTAVEIEKRRTSHLAPDYQQAIQPMHEEEASKFRTILAGDEKARTSLTTLKLTVGLFRGLNNQIVREMEAAQLAGNPALETDLRVKHILVVYELLEFAISNLSAYGTGGIDDVKKICSAEINRLKSKIYQQENRIQEIRRNVDFTQEDKDKKERAVREEILKSNTLINEWQSFQETFENRNTPEGLRRALALLRDTRESVKSEIVHLSSAALLRVLRDSTSDVSTFAVDLEKLEIFYTTPDDLLRLSGSLDTGLPKITP